jgi:vacuolar-type H+-ATPase subunit I/STV1
MKKVSLVAPVSSADGIIQVLQDVGVVEIEKTEVESEEYSLYDLSEVAPDLDKRQEELSRTLMELEFCIDFFNKFEWIKKNIVQQFAGGKVYLPNSTFDDLGSRVEEGHKIYEECRRIDEGLSKRSNEESLLLG